MAIMMQAQIAGMTREQYEGMTGMLHPQLKQTPGFLAHAGGPIPGGWLITEFWESQETFDNWLKETIIPGSKAAGLAPPNLQIFQVHTITTR